MVHALRKEYVIAHKCGQIAETKLESMVKS